MRSTSVSKLEFGSHSKSKMWPDVVVVVVVVIDAAADEVMVAA
jgi:hypothetical protein